MLSSDAKTVKIWNRHDGAVVTNVETPADINDVCVAHDARWGVGCRWLLAVAGIGNDDRMTDEHT